MQQPRNTTKLYRLPPNVIYFLFYCKSNLFFIFLNKNKRKMIYKNIISFTILYFTDVFKCGIPDATESYSFQSVFTTFCTEINH